MIAGLILQVFINLFSCLDCWLPVLAIDLLVLNFLSFFHRALVTGSTQMLQKLQVHSQLHKQHISYTVGSHYRIIWVFTIVLTVMFSGADAFFFCSLLQQSQLNCNALTKQMATTLDKEGFLLSVHLFIYFQNRHKTQAACVSLKVKHERSVEPVSISCQ